MTEAERQNVALRTEAQEYVDLLDDRPPHFWRCLAEAAAARTKARPAAPPSLVVDVMELLRGFADPELSFQLTFLASLDVIQATASAGDERMSHSLQLSVLKHGAEPDVMVAELLRRLARNVTRARGGEVLDG
jgi:hypothetical protein